MNEEQLNTGKNQGRENLINIVYIHEYIYKYIYRAV